MMCFVRKIMEIKGKGLVGTKKPKFKWKILTLTKKKRNYEKYSIV